MLDKFIGIGWYMLNEDYDLEGYLRLAKNVSKHSNHKYKIGCVICSPKPISVGFNKTKTHPRYANPDRSIRRALHAEVSAVISAGKESIQGGTAYIYRELQDGTPATARPCKHCMGILREFGVTKICYTIGVYPYYKTERI